MPIFMPHFMFVGGAQILYTESRSSETDTSSYTFSSCDFGSVSGANRMVIVAVSGSSSPGPSFSSVTIGGTAATVAEAISTGANSVNGHAAVVYAEIPSASSGDVVVAWTGAMRSCGISVFSAAGLVSNTPYDNDKTSNVLSLSMSIAANGFAIAAAFSVGQSSYTWTNITERLEYVDSGGGGVGGAANTDLLPAQTRTISVSPSSGAGNSVIACATWR